MLWTGEETLHVMAKQKPPAKIKKKINKCGRQDMVINRNTTITPTMAKLKHQAQHDVMSTASLTHDAADQLAAIKGYVQYLGVTKIIVIQGSPLQK